jgi:hypothetical protein
MTNCQGPLNGGRRAHHCTGNERGIAPLHALYLTPASCSCLSTHSARLYAEHVPLPRIKLDEQPVHEIIT